jgi:chromatin segregation and condensation protein Rec8/ScpA/Scc1 (kleisin family)
LLPAVPDAATETRRRSAWTSTFIASLELAKQGDIALEQENWGTDIHVRLAKLEHG